LYLQSAECTAGLRTFAEYRASPNVLELKRDKRMVRLSAMVDEPLIVVYQESHGDPLNKNILFAPSKNYVWQTESGKQIHTSFIFRKSARLSAIHEELFMHYRNIMYDIQGKQRWPFFFCDWLGPRNEKDD